MRPSPTLRRDVRIGKMKKATEARQRPNGQKDKRTTERESAQRASYPESSACAKSREREKGQSQMKIDEIKKSVSLKAFAEEHLKPCRGTFVCPKCGSGSGPKGTPAFNLYKGPDGIERFHCYSNGCGIDGDVLDLAGIVFNTDDKREQIKAVSDWAGLRDEKGRSEPSESRSRAFEGTPLVGLPNGSEKPSETVPEALKASRKREAERIDALKANIDHPEAVAYLESRGRSLEWARSHGFGYEPSKRRIIMPWKGAAWYHIDRDITGSQYTHKYLKPPKDIVGEQPFYNLAAVEGEKTVIIVEGVMDAIAVEDCGHAAIALGGSSSYKMCAAFTAVAEPLRPNILIIPDRDAKAGHDGAMSLSRHLSEAGVERVSIIEPPTTLTGKDTDEMDVADHDALKAWLDSEVIAAERREAEEAEERYNSALNNLHVMSPTVALTEIADMSDYERPVPTGIRGLDRALNGGFCRGVVVMGAISSLGKTTLMLQVADHIAANGRPVLFVTIEQSAKELVSKSLSRLMRPRGYKVPDLDIRGIMRTTWGERQNAAFAAACADYETTVAPNLKFMEGDEQPSVIDVRAAAERMMHHDGIAPIVFIDYLQLMKPLNERYSDKQATDKNMTLLRQMARDLKTTVVVISSLNRTSYSGVITLSSFKESGAIEYGADVLLGLQPDNLRERVKDREKGQKVEDRADEIIENTKERDIRELEILILKNRFGPKPKNGITVTMDAASNAVFSGEAKYAPKVGE